MRYLNAMLVRLLRLSLPVRLVIVISSFVVCLILYFFSQFNGPLLSLPVALVVWLFKRRGATIGIGFTLFAIIIISTVSSPGLPQLHPPLMGVLTGSAAILTEGFFIGYLRYLLDQAETARLRRLEAEQQRHIAYEQRIAALQAEQRMTLAYQQQRQLNQAKDQFILHVNHELRSPLTALHGWLEILSLRLVYKSPISTKLDRAANRSFIWSIVCWQLLTSVATCNRKSQRTALSRGSSAKSSACSIHWKSKTIRSRWIFLSN